MRWIDDRVQLAHHVVEKPILFGEVGFRTDRRRLHGVPPAAWLNRFLSRVRLDGAAGALVWTYLPTVRERQQYHVYVSGERERETRAFRRVVARNARRFRARAPRSRNPRLGAERGEAPLFDPHVTIRVRRDPHDTWTGDALRFDPRELERARFEGAGTHDGDPGLPHFYGGGTGEVTYRIRTPRAAPDALVLRLHASAELPGAGAGPEDVSTLTVELDGVALGTLTAPPDDGVGEVLELRVEAPALPRRRTRRLTIRADRGVCLYASDPESHATGVELRWERTAE